MDLIPADQIKPGMVVSTVRHANARGEEIRPIRATSWRTVLITEENIGGYVDSPDGAYWFAAPTAAQRLIHAGFSRRKYGVSDCGEALTASGPRLNGLACKRPGSWVKPGEPGRCLQHAAMTL